MPYCERCQAQRPEGSAYCSECGFRLKSGDDYLTETSDEGEKMGEAAATTSPATPYAARRQRRLLEVWNILGTAGKVIIAGAILAIIGFFVPSSRVVPPGLVVTRSLATIGGAFLLIPVLAISVIVLLFVSGQRRPLRNRLFLYTTMIAIGAFTLPAAFIAWLSGLVGGVLVILGFLAVIAGGYVMMSDSTQSLA